MTQLFKQNPMKWWTICLSIMATQASAITFLSTPGQAFEDGMRFIQFYFGLPIAMVIISITAVPVFAKLNVYTAYEYLESRFDLKTRTLAAFLFLIQRGLAAGITIFAPSIILSAMLGWKLAPTNILIGSAVILYTVSGGTKAVSVTQKQQMAVMMGGMIVAGIVVVNLLPADIGLSESLLVAGSMGKMNLVDFSFDWKDRYNFWSGITGGLFLALSYFGTDQSQVARYLGGKSETESRLGLLFNGLLKIPMQFIILFIGVLVFVFYQFHQPPVFFNNTSLQYAKNSEYATEVDSLENRHAKLFQLKEAEIKKMINAEKTGNFLVSEQAKQRLKDLNKETRDVKEEVKIIIKKAAPKAEIKDTDYVFITFVMNYMPKGLVGLLIAVILCAAMSSTASELNALASTTTVDIYKRSIKKDGNDLHYLNASRWFTIFWGVVAIIFALVASLLENLIQAVNILGSLFYGTILGIFVSAFYFRYIRSDAVFIAAIIAEICVLTLYTFTDIGFLWYNVIGCIVVVIVGFILQKIISQYSVGNRQ
ncbi:MAG: sodium:solute symporter [Cytophagaceae bacterium]